MNSAESGWSDGIMCPALSTINSARFLFALTKPAVCPFSSLLTYLRHNSTHRSPQWWAQALIFTFPMGYFTFPHLVQHCNCWEEHHDLRPDCSVANRKGQHWNAWTRWRVRIKLLFLGPSSTSTEPGLLVVCAQGGHSIVRWP